MTISTSNGSRIVIRTEFESLGERLIRLGRRLCQYRDRRKGRAHASNPTAA
jgi:hypothetical protein